MRVPHEDPLSTKKLLATYGHGFKSRLVHVSCQLFGLESVLQCLLGGLLPAYAVVCCCGQKVAWSLQLVGFERVSVVLSVGGWDLSLRR